MTTALQKTNDFIIQFQAGGKSDLRTALESPEGFDDSSLSFSYGATTFDYVAEQVCELGEFVDIDGRIEDMIGVLMTMLPDHFAVEGVVAPVVAGVIVFGIETYCKERE